MWRRLTRKVVMIISGPPAPAAMRERNINWEAPAKTMRETAMVSIKRRFVLRPKSPNATAVVK